MKKILLLAAALACSGAVAQEKEVWACQQIGGTMLKWEGSSWRSVGLSAIPLLLTLDGENSSYKMGEITAGLTCLAPKYGWLSCLTTARYANHILMDLESGRLGMSALTGAVAASTGNYRDTITAEAFNCTKF